MGREKREGASRYRRGETEAKENRGRTFRPLTMADRGGMAEGLAAS